MADAARYLKALQDLTVSGVRVPRGSVWRLPTPPGLENIYAPELREALASGLFVEVADFNSPLPDDPTA